MNLLLSKIFFRRIVSLLKTKIYKLTLLITCILHLYNLFSANTLRLWQPQLFATLNHVHGDMGSGAMNFTFCEILDSTNSKAPKLSNPDVINQTLSTECIPVRFHYGSHN